MSPNFDVKIIDFGLSAVKEIEVEEKQGNEKKVFGTPKYLAPEVWLGGAPNEKSDIYAYGIVLWEIFTRDPKGPYSKYASFKVNVSFPSLKNFICLFISILLCPLALPNFLFHNSKAFADGVVRRQERPEIPSTVPNGVSDLIESCWHPEDFSAPQ